MRLLPAHQHGSAAAAGAADAGCKRLPNTDSAFRPYCCPNAHTSGLLLFHSGRTLSQACQVVVDEVGAAAAPATGRPAKAVANSVIAIAWKGELPCFDPKAVPAGLPALWAYIVHAGLNQLGQLHALGLLVLPPRGRVQLDRSPRCCSAVLRGAAAARVEALSRAR